MKHSVSWKTHYNLIWFVM